VRRDRGRAAPGGARARMFVALDLPEPARGELAAWRDALIAGRSDLRPVRPEALHVTLAFLGWQDEAAMGRIAETAFGAVAGLGPATLRSGEVKAVPPRGSRLFALDLEDEGGRCGAVQAAISSALAARRFYRPEKRPFWPHVTLARVKRDARAGPLEEPQATPPGPFEAGELTLYKSTLRPQGALYEPLARTSLGA
jgi:RNA 2',3'-cyclic 3'-phosphodiesterase